MTDRPLVVISTYPPEHCGVGRDAFYQVQALRAFQPVRVLGNRVEGGVPVQEGAEFAWRKGDPLYPWRLFRRVRAVAPGGNGVIHVYHHFFLYGGPLTILEFPLLPLLLKLGGYEVVVQFQSVVDPTSIVAEELGGLDVRPGWVTRRILRAFYRSVDAFSDRLVVCTSSMQRLLAAAYGVAADRVQLVPVGWWSSADGAGTPPAPPQTSGPRTVLFHGFLDPTKGLDDLVRAFGQLARNDPDLTLVLAGEPSPQLEDAGRPFVRSLEKIADEAGVRSRVQFTGYLDDAALAATLASADLVVLPYTMGYSHGGSAVLSRVAGLGRPLIASQISRFADELQDGVDAILVPPKDVPALAEAMRRVLTDPALALRLGRALREHSLSRSWTDSARRLLRDVYPLGAPALGPA